MWKSELPLDPVGEETVFDIVNASIATNADRTSLVDGPTGRSVTYAELGRRVDRIAAWMYDEGLRPGGVVALWAENTPPWAACQLAAIRLGAAVTGINPAYTPDEARPQLRLADMVVTGPARVPDAAGNGERPVLALGDGTGATSLREVLGSDRPSVQAHADATTVALLPFSSGTTGLAKGVVLDHRNVVAGVRLAATATGLGPDDVVLTVAPFFHVLGGIVGLLCPLAAGSTLVTLPRFEPAALLEAVSSHRVSMMAVPPPLARFLAQTPGEHDLSSLRLLAVGGAPLPVAVQEALQRRLPDCVVGQGYGLTETTASVCVPYRLRSTTPGSVGHLAPGTQLRVVAETGRDLGDGETGELWVRGAQVMRGYLDDADATTAALTPDGWLRTGDLGYVHGGEVYLVDRIKELIKVDGYQVAPAEVEAVLQSHPDVADAVVVARPDDEHGEVPIAFVVGPAEPADLAHWVGERLAAYKRPVAFKPVEQVPRTPSGKVLRRLLTQLDGAPQPVA